MRNPLDICIHRLPVILRDLRGCNCGGPRDSYGCGHWTNEMAECVTVPLTQRQTKKYGEVTACMNCAAYEPRPGAVVKAKRQDLKQEPAARSKERKTADIKGIPTARLRKAREQREFEEGMLRVGSG